MPILNGFLGPTYPNRSINFQSDRTINFFPELSPSPDAKTVIALIGCPGTELSLEVGNGPIRGTHVAAGCMFVVSGDSLYSVNTSSVVSASLGTLVTSSGRVQMKFNGLTSAGAGGNQLAIVDGVNLYIYNVFTEAFTTVSAATVGITPSAITYLDGYFVIVDSTSMNARSSTLYDGLTWPGLALSPISSSPENLVGCCSNSQELWFIKEFTTELWYDAGIATSSGFPFMRVPGGVLNYGTTAPNSVVAGDNSVFMVGVSRNEDAGQFVGIVAFAGGVFTVISPPSINYQIAQMADITDAFSFMFSMEGHTFLVVTFPTGDATFIFDTTTKMWHERSSYADNPYDYHMWNASTYSYFNNTGYIGDMVNGNIYRLSSSLFTENGDPIVSVRITPSFFDNMEMDNIFIHKLELDVETGVGDQATSIGIDPQAELSWSMDGGHTWSSEYPASMGKKGSYTINPTWRRLGAGRNRVFRVAMSAPVKRVVLGAYAETSQ
jgi:hypothetical protein